MSTAPPPSDRRTPIAVRVVLGGALLLTFLALALVIAAYRNDGSITKALGEANAEVVSVGWDRTIVRFQTPDGVIHIPQNGVLYPDGLTEGQLVRVEYSAAEPDLVRVAGRTGVLALLPAGSTILITWLVAGPVLWWLRRSAARLTRHPATS